MLPFHRLFRHTLVQSAVALVVAASWLSGCGDDTSDFSDKGKGKGGSGGTSGGAGAATGGITGGSGGTPMAGSGGGPTGGSGGSGGSGGAPTGGSGGAMGGSAGSAGTGMGGEGMGGEGGVGEGGVGQGGEGGAPDGMCTTANLGLTLVSSAPMQQHDHLPVNGAARTTLLGMINSGMPLTFTLPMDGTNVHTHTLTFTAPQLTILRNGGALGMNVTTAMGGPMGNMHTHTYSIECQP